MDLIPGFIQGLTRVTISYPFDTVKIYMQKNLYNNTYDAIKNIIKTEPKIFYRGSSITYIVIPTERSIQFYMVEKYKNEINPIVISIILGVVSVFYNLPLQYFTANIVLEKKDNYTNIKSFVKNMEFKNLYKGISVELPKTLLSSGSYMGSYYYLREKYNKENNLYKAPLIGIASSIFCWCLFFPIDTIRNDLQTTKNITLKELIYNRYSKHGLFNFYKGLMPVFIRTIPSSAIGMWAYESTRKITDKLK